MAESSDKYRNQLSRLKEKIEALRQAGDLSDEERRERYRAVVDEYDLLARDLNAGSIDPGIQALIEEARRELGA